MLYYSYHVQMKKLQTQFQGNYQIDCGIYQKTILERSFLSAINLFKQNKKVIIVIQNQKDTSNPDKIFLFNSFLINFPK